MHVWSLACLHYPQKADDVERLVFASLSQSMRAADFEV
jgi:hypothetical protein